MEYAQQGALLKVIEGRSLSREVVFAIFKEILEGVKELHSNRIIHRDLKIENILLNGKFEIKICDFGLAKVNKFEDNKTVIGQYESLGSPQTIAPEALGKKVGPSSTVDIWALGCILYYLIFGVYPFQKFPAINLEEHKYNILNKEIEFEKNHHWFNINKENELVDLLRSFFQKEPKNRIKLDQIENSNWYKKQIILWKKDNINNIVSEPAISLKNTKKLSNNLNV
jgi:serine/threonine protein kinase